MACLGCWRWPDPDCLRSNVLYVATKAHETPRLSSFGDAHGFGDERPCEGRTLQRLRNEGGMNTRRLSLTRPPGFNTVVGIDPLSQEHRGMPPIRAAASFSSSKVVYRTFSSSNSGLSGRTQRRLRLRSSPPPLVVEVPNAREAEPVATAGPVTGGYLRPVLQRAVLQSRPDNKTGAWGGEFWTTWLPGR